MAKHDITNVHRFNLDAAHTATYKNNTTIRQRGGGVVNTISTDTRSLINSIKCDGKYVKFRRNPTIATLYNNDDATLFTYNSGSGRHYLIEKDRKKLGLPILRVSAKKVGIVNGGTCKGKYVTKLTFPQLSNKAAEADTFEEFPASLMSVGKTDDNGNLSNFTREGVTLYKE